jgi:RHS repeat-associated protein
MISSTRLIAVVLLFTGCLSLANANPAPCANNLPKTGHGTDISLERSPANDPNEKDVCVGSTITLHVATPSDRDVYGEPIVCQDVTPILTWSIDPGGDTNEHSTSYTFHAPTTPGYHTVTCTARDGGDAEGQPGYDFPTSVSWTITVVDLDWLKGPDESTGLDPINVCVGAEALFTAQTEPFGYESWIEWKVDGNVVTPNETGTQLIMVWGEGECGTHTVSASACGTTRSLVVNVKPHVPTCDNQPLTCMIGGGGCGTCGGDGSGLPDADLRDDSVVTPVPYPGGPGIWPYYPNLNDPDGETCGKDTMKLVAACDGNTYLQYKGGCSGKCYVIDVTSGSSWGIGDGITITGGGQAYTVEDAGGTTSTFNLSEPDASSCFESGPVGPSTVTSPNGQTMTTALDGNGHLDYVDSPTGRWEYTVDSAGKLTTIAPPDPDGARIELSYVTSGSAAGKPEWVKQWANESDYNNRGTYPNNYLSMTSYYYDGTSGKLTQAIRGNRTLNYSYGTNTITIEETDVTTHIKTVYDYGTFGVTKVTRKHQSDSQKDQMTQYTFTTNSAGYRMYVTELQDPEGNITHYDLDTDGAVTAVYNLVDNWAEHVISTTYATGTKNGVSYKVGPETITYPGNFTEEYTYYQVSGNNTPYVKTHKDIRGKYTLYLRDTASEETLWKVTAVKVHDAVSGGAPSDYDWSLADPIKTSTYYTSGIQSGLVQTETVPDIDGATDSTTTYKWYETINSVDILRPGPTTTTYKWWDPTANGGSGGYVDKYEWNTYDAAGRVVKHTDASGDPESTSATGKTWYTYDALGRPLQTIYTRSGGTESGAALAYTENTYSCCGLTQSRDEEGRSTYFDYDNANRITGTYTSLSGQSSTYPLVAYTYDAFGNKLTAMTRSDSGTTRATSYEYDKDNRVIRITYQDNLLGEEQFGYDVYGNQWYKRQKNATNDWKTTFYKYDDLNRVTDIYYATTTDTRPTAYPTGSSDVQYTYYGGSSLRYQMTDSQGTSVYEYDTQGRMTKYTPPIGLSANYYVAYDYNNLGQKTLVKITDGTNTDYDLKYDYFANGWLKDAKTGDGSGTYSDLARFSYNPVGTRSRQDNYYGGNRKSYSTYAYDSDPRYSLNNISHYKDGNPTALETIDYTRLGRDKVGNPLSADDWRGNTSYTYDANNRLDNATYPGSVSEDYGYDWVGNRKNPPGSPYPMVFNKVDQLTSRPANGERTWTYDRLGNLNQIAEPDSVILRDFSYFGSGLLNRARFNYRSQYIDNYWDGDANRVQFDYFDTEDTYTYRFVYDVTAGIPAVAKETTPTTTVYYYREPSGELLARQEGTTGTTRRYYHFDGLGSTSLLTNTNGDWTDKYSYDGWGNVLQHSTAAGSISQPYQYVGQLGYYTHCMLASYTDFRYLQLGVRFYDPQVGRFTQRDRIDDGHNNYYVYAMAQPMTATDATGLYAGGKGCAGTHMDDWLKLVNAALQKPACQAALQSAGIANCVKNNLAGLTFNCGNAHGNNAETNPCAPYDIVVDTASPGNGPGTLLHEAVHACRKKLGLFTADRSPGTWSCSSCGRTWGGNAPYPYIHEEKIASGVQHKCGL